MSPKFKTKEFKDLKDKWYAKLAVEKFNDIEQDEHHLKQWVGSQFTYRMDPHQFDTNQKYFQLAGQFLHSYKFADLA